MEWYIIVVLAAIAILACTWVINVRTKKAIKAKKEAERAAKKKAGGKKKKK